MWTHQSGAAANAVMQGCRCSWLCIQYSHPRLYGMAHTGTSPVKFDMICARRLGKLVPRWQLGSLPALRGTLLMREEHDHELNRTTRCARFIVDQGQRDAPVPMLWDA